MGKDFYQKRSAPSEVAADGDATAPRQAPHRTPGINCRGHAPSLPVAGPCVPIHFPAFRRAAVDWQSPQSNGC